VCTEAPVRCRWPWQGESLDQSIIGQVGRIPRYESYGVLYCTHCNHPVAEIRLKVQAWEATATDSLTARSWGSASVDQPGRGSPSGPVRGTLTLRPGQMQVRRRGEQMAFPTTDTVTSACCQHADEVMHFAHPFRRAVPKGT
jgi:hypothetical protein